LTHPHPVHCRHVLRKPGAGSPDPDDEPAAVRAIHEDGLRRTDRHEYRQIFTASSSRDQEQHLDGLAEGGATHRPQTGLQGGANGGSATRDTPSQATTLANEA
jgi:hypothetical protein